MIADTIGPCHPCHETMLFARSYSPLQSSCLGTQQRSLLRRFRSSCLQYSHQPLGSLVFGTSYR